VSLPFIETRIAKMVLTVGVRGAKANIKRSGGQNTRDWRNKDTHDTIRRRGIKLL
jgi:hypothetical protein